MRTISKRVLERALNLPPRRRRGENLVRLLEALPDNRRTQAVEALDRAWREFWRGVAEGGARREN
ncbi:hypothetical protein [Desulfovirgula thermocuniculi]|uniref:hypothetical protein n=1 Tax=Desulfovirgula thermocuniculi TaxID=348842 RepID=UPI000488D4AD|nr:hypothetical protein [Desulfovirgula thermocuniculi]